MNCAPSSTESQSHPHVVITLLGTLSPAGLVVVRALPWHSPKKSLCQWRLKLSPVLCKSLYLYGFCPVCSSLVTWLPKEEAAIIQTLTSTYIGRVVGSGLWMTEQTPPDSQAPSFAALVFSLAGPFMFLLQ